MARQIPGRARSADGNRKKAWVVRMLLAAMVIGCSALPAAAVRRPTDYYQLTNAAELAICAGKTDDALLLYRHAFAVNPASPFSRDLLNAFFAAMDHGDTAFAGQQLQRLLARGLSQPFIRSRLLGNYSGREKKKIKEWIDRFPNGVLVKRDIAGRMESLELAESNARAASARRFGPNFMTEEVYRVDSLTAAGLLRVVQNGFPDQQALGHYRGEPWGAPYHTIVVHDMQRAHAGRGTALFDSLLYAGIRTYAVHPIVYAGLISILLDARLPARADSFIIRTAVHFPVVAYNGKLYLQKMSDAVVARMNGIREKLSLCTIEELMQKVAYNEQPGNIFKYVMTHDLSRVMHAQSEQVAIDWRNSYFDDGGR